MLRRLSDKEFCSAAHQKAYMQEQEELALARLLESRSGKAPAAPASRRDNRTDIPSIVHDHTVLPEAFDPLSSLSHPDLNQALDSLLSQSGLDSPGFSPHASAFPDANWPPGTADHLSWTPAGPGSPGWADAAPDQHAWDLIDQSLERTQRMPNLDSFTSHLALPPAPEPEAARGSFPGQDPVLSPPATGSGFDLPLDRLPEIAAPLAAASAPIVDYRLPAPAYQLASDAFAPSSFPSDQAAPRADAALDVPAPVSDDPPFAQFTVDAPVANEISDLRPLLHVDPIRHVPTDFVTPDTVTHLVSMARTAAAVPVPMPGLAAPSTASPHPVGSAPLVWPDTAPQFAPSALTPEPVVVEETFDVPEPATALAPVAPPARRAATAPTAALPLPATVLPPAVAAVAFSSIALAVTAAAPPIIEQAVQPQAPSAPAATTAATPAVRPTTLTMLSLAILGERLIDDVPGEQALVALPALPPTRLAPVAIHIEAVAGPLHGSPGRQPAVWDALSHQNFAFDLLRLRASVGAVDLSPALEDIPSAPVLDPEPLESWAA